MGFFIVGLILWLLIGASALLFLWGLWKKSWKAFLFSGLAFIMPSYYFWGAENWLRIIGLLPWLLLGLAYYTYKRKH